MYTFGHIHSLYHYNEEVASLPGGRHSTVVTADLQRTVRCWTQQPETSRDYLFSISLASIAAASDLL